ncbi:MAG: hypothetical protein OES79_08305 [Planctomycetota bacterium]|nr:hypothetical protein [Planctomycetota bacterium]
MTSEIRYAAKKTPDPFPVARATRKGSDWMMKYIPGGPHGAQVRSRNYFYAHCYAVQAAG